MEYEEYVKDSRIACKYGSKCYQKNPLHHKKYKHPPQKGNPRKDKQDTPLRKRRRIEQTNTNELPRDQDQSVSDDADKSTEKIDSVSSTDTSESDDDANNTDQTSDTAPTDSVTHKSIDTKDFDEVSLSTDADEAALSTDADVAALSTDADKAALSKKVERLGVKTSDSKENEQLKTYSKVINEKFLIKLPQDFYDFWKFCEKMKPNNPVEALKGINLELVGPFDVLAGKFDNIEKSDDEYLIHWRYFRDPPEFLTVLKGDDKTGYHIGYFRDSPEEVPILLASNESEKDGVFTLMGGNIFAAVSFYIENLKKTADPFKKMMIPKIETLLNEEAKRLSLEMNRKTKAIAARERRIVSRTMNKIGLVVPYDKKTQLGYRELEMNNKELKNVFDKLQNCLPEQREKYLSDLQPVLTYANIAADECDFGTGIELGWNIISHGIDSLNSTALQSLASNYRLLNREAFAKIAEAHMKNRKKGCKLSVL